MDLSNIDLSNIDLIIYHDDCPDGLAAVWAVKQRFPHADTVGCVYNTFTLDEMIGRARARGCVAKAVIVVDFSFRREQLLGACERLQLDKLVVLDHHDSAARDLEGVEDCIFDMSRSGAQMAWDYCFPSTPRPAFIDYVADRDLWKWELPLSREVNYARLNYSNDLDGITAFGNDIEEDLDAVAAAGAAQLVVYWRRIDVAAATTTSCRIGGHAGRAVIADREIRSELGAALLEKFPDAEFVCVLTPILRNGNIAWAASLRSCHGRAQVQILAEALGGGGHEHAAGFKITEASQITRLLSTGL